MRVYIAPWRRVGMQPAGRLEPTCCILEALEGPLRIVFCRFAARRAAAKRGRERAQIVQHRLQTQMETGQGGQPERQRETQTIALEGENPFFSLRTEILPIEPSEKLRI